MEAKLPLSIILIARNAEKEIPRALQGLSKLAAEIIAVINDCTDNTREILESYGARVIDCPWQGMTMQKNEALKYATQPWVFNIDTDEEPSQELLDSIAGIIKRNDPHIAAYSMPRLSLFLGRWIRHGDLYPDRVIRLFQREKSRFVGAKDHDKIKADGPILKLQAQLYHYSFPTLDTQLEKMPRFGGAFLERLRARKKTFFACEAVFRAFWRFFRAYILRLGFLDGFEGFYIAYFYSFFTLYRYTKLLEDERNHQSTK